MTTEPKIYETSLGINENKVRHDQPDLVGTIDLEGTDYRVALWNQTTKDGLRDYFSGSLQAAGDKDAERYKIKLYEFRKALDSEPDYHTTERAPIGARLLFSYLTITPGANGEDYNIKFELRDLALKQKLSEEAEEFRARLAEKFSAAGVAAKAKGEPSPLSRRGAHRESLEDEPDDITW